MVVKHSGMDGPDDDSEDLVYAGTWPYFIKLQFLSNTMIPRKMSSLLQEHFEDREFSMKSSCDQSTGNEVSTSFNVSTSWIHHLLMK